MNNHQMHETMERLYAAALKIKGVEGQTNVAGLLNDSPQRLANWEKRGVSNRGALKVQRVIGCNSLWIMTGDGNMIDGPLSTKEPSAADYLPRAKTSDEAALLAAFNTLDRKAQALALAEMQHKARIAVIERDFQHSHIRAGDPPPKKTPRSA